MKIKIKKNSFINSLNIVQKALPSKTTFPILECILIDASKDKIYLISTDNEISIKTEAIGEIIEKGKTCVEGRLFIDIIRNMPDNDEDIEINTNKELICNIKCNELKQSIFSKDPETYPDISSINKNNKIVISEYILKRMVEKTSFAYSRDSKIENVTLKGINVEIDKNNIKFTAMDGYIFAINKNTLREKHDKISFIIPGKSLDEIYKIVKGEVEKEVEIYINDKNISFYFNNTLFISNKIIGNYIKLDRFINQEYTTKVIVNKKEIKESIERSIIFTNEVEKKPVMLEFNDNFLTVSLQSMIGEIKQKIEINKTGNNLTLLLNPNNLCNILNAIDDEEVTFYMTLEKAPVIIKDNNETYFYFIQPLIRKNAS